MGLEAVKLKYSCIKSVDNMEMNESKENRVHGRGKAGSKEVQNINHHENIDRR